MKKIRLVMTVIMAGALAAFAGTPLTWQGASGANNNTGSATNWVQGAIPVSNTLYDAVFNANNLIGPSYRATVANSISNLTYSSVQLAGGGTTNFTFIDQAVGKTNVLTGDITVTSGSHTLNQTLWISSNSTWNIAAGSALTRQNNKDMLMDAGVTLTKAGEGTLYITATSNLTTGTIRLTEGTLRASGGDPTLGAGTAKLALDGGTLHMSGPANGNGALLDRNTTVGGNMTIISDKSGTAGIGVVYRFGTLDIGAQTLTVKSGTNVTSGTAQISFFGATALSGNTVFDVTNNTAGVSTRLTLMGAVSGANGLTKTGNGELLLSGTNTYSGNTTVSMGLLTMADNSGLKFVIGGNGVNNQINGTGTASLAGDFTFDLSGASQTVGSSWTIVDAASLNETFTTTFTVIGFTDAGSDLWTKDINGSKYYQFSEGTGALTVIPEPATIGMLGLGALMTLLIRRMSTR